jgi:hypothetical protein
MERHRSAPLVWCRRSSSRRSCPRRRPYHRGRERRNRTSCGRGQRPRESADANADGCHGVEREPVDVKDCCHAQSADAGGCRRGRVVAGARGCGDECSATGAGDEQRCDADRPDRPFHRRILTPVVVPFDRLRLGRVAAVRDGKRECKSGSVWRARGRSRTLECLHEAEAACTHEDAHAAKHVTSVAPPGRQCAERMPTLPSGARCSARLCADSGGIALGPQHVASCHARTRD